MHKKVHLRLNEFHILKMSGVIKKLPPFNKLCDVKLSTIWN